MRRVIPFLMALTAVALVGCGSDEKAAPLPLAQRFVSAADAPGTKLDPVETRETTRDFDEFIAGLKDRVVDPEDAEMTKVFQKADFKSAGVDARFFGETHTGVEPHVFSSFVELESEDGATSALDWLETDSLKPCPTSCAVQRSSFDVDGIDGARGVHALATAADIANSGNGDQMPFNRYWIGFTIGASVYTVELFSRKPGAISEEQALDIANAYYDRLTKS